MFHLPDASNYTDIFDGRLKLNHTLHSHFDYQICKIFSKNLLKTIPDLKLVHTKVCIALLSPTYKLGNDVINDTQFITPFQLQRHIFVPTNISQTE